MLSSCRCHDAVYGVCMYIVDGVDRHGYLRASELPLSVIGLSPNSVNVPLSILVKGPRSTHPKSSTHPSISLSAQKTSDAVYLSNYNMYIKTHKICIK